jgi:hypothetical protein
MRAIRMPSRPVRVKKYTPAAKAEPGDTGTDEKGRNPNHGFQLHTSARPLTSVNEHKDP